MQIEALNPFVAQQTANERIGVSTKVRTKNIDVKDIEYFFYSDSLRKINPVALQRCNLGQVRGLYPSVTKAARDFPGCLFLFARPVRYTRGSKKHPEKKPLSEPAPAAVYFSWLFRGAVQEGSAKNPKPSIGICTHCQLVGAAELYRPYNTKKTA